MANRKDKQSQNNNSRDKRIKANKYESLGTHNQQQQQKMTKTCMMSNSSCKCGTIWRYGKEKKNWISFIFVWSLCKDRYSSDRATTRVDSIHLAILSHSIFAPFVSYCLSLTNFVIRFRFYWHVSTINWCLLRLYAYWSEYKVIVW